MCGKSCGQKFHKSLLSVLVTVSFGGRGRGSWGLETIGHWTMLLLQEASLEYLIYEIGIIPIVF